MEDISLDEFEEMQQIKELDINCSKCGLNKSNDSLFQWNFNLEDSDSDFTDIDFSSSKKNTASDKDIEPIIFVRDETAKKKPEEKRPQGQPSASAQNARKTQTSGTRPSSRPSSRPAGKAAPKKKKTSNFPALNWKLIAVIAAAVLLIALLTFVFSNLSFFLAGSPFSGRVAEDIYTIRTLADGMGIAVLLGFQSRISELLTQKELYSMRHVLDSQYEQFRNYQESEEMLHMMQHDLKHQLNGLRGETDEEKRAAWLDWMENELNKWWIPQRTGNPVFDTILAATLRKARQLDVRITCVADGALLGRMHVADICTIFGNALDNAMESVVMIPEPEKRLIHVSVSAQKKFIFINISNTLGTALIESPDGLVTTKKDKKKHGYGIKGIRYAVGKYNGNVSYKAEDGWFRLNILIPM